MFRGYLKDSGIVIKQFDVGEIDRIAVVFTKRMGKIKAMAKGARKVGNRLGGALDKFVFSEFLFYAGHSLPVIVQAEIKRSFRMLASSFEKWLLGNYVLYLIDQSLEEQSRQESLFGEVLKIFSFADKSAPETVRRGVLKFKLMLLQCLGIQPQLTSCATCNRENKKFHLWSHAEGGVICESCASKPELSKNCIYISQDTILIWLHLLNLSYPLLSKLKLTGEQFFHLDELSSEYFSYHLNKNILSIEAFLARYPEKPTVSEL
ncbi:MAG: DNA repair protein RecO [Candidatus Atribacteria bacterium]|nr:DNA repair protein RecO [Candidatus Atribacteria bacterium]MCD6350402.1 DNA repair protein RecO [Candidatus Atribacteria bacterium]